ncbi:MAG: hypothetical protein ABW171_06070 [Steroidobacter sp.]
MQRRTFLATALATLALSSSLSGIAAARSTPNKTRWQVRASEGFDALAFLGPLAGNELYTRYYGAEATAFASRLPEAARNDIVKLSAEATSDGYGLLGPNLSVLLSTDGNDATVDSVIAAIKARDQRILPKYMKSPYWDEKDWGWFDRMAPRLEVIFSAMRDAGFAAFRAEHTGDLSVRVADVQRSLNSFDVITWQEKLTGRTFEPTIEIVLLQFSKPHGIKVQGQTFLQATDYDVALTVRIAAHEMLHPPVPMQGEAALAALKVLERDALMMKIVREHDPRWGYTTLEGVLNEDLTEALDQLISEALGVGRNPADRWREADDGMHVLAAGLYGLLRQDRWVDTGGSIEAWLAEATRKGRLAPKVLHPVASRVLERPVDKLWPLQATTK